MSDWKNAMLDSGSAYSGTDSGLNFRSEAVFAAQHIQKSDYSVKVANSNTHALKLAMENAAAIGLTLNPAVGFASLIPRYGKIVLDVSYKGLVELARQSGEVLNIAVTRVYSKDSWTFKGPFQEPTHHYDTFAAVEVDA